METPAPLEQLTMWPWSATSWRSTSIAPRDKAAKWSSLISEFAALHFRVTLQYLRSVGMILRAKTVITIEPNTRLNADVVRLVLVNGSGCRHSNKLQASVDVPDLNTLIACRNETRVTIPLFQRKVRRSGSQRTMCIEDVAE